MLKMIKNPKYNHENYLVPHDKPSKFKFYVELPCINPCCKIEEC